MKVAKILLPSGKESLALVEGEDVAPIVSAGGQFQTLTDLLEADDPASMVELLAASASERLPLTSVSMLPPVDQQEVWAAGVTYTRSRKARMDESVGAASFYDKVYEAERPELFFKSMPYRVVGHEHTVRIRKDARWNVPEPELALVINSRMELVGFTIGNDMSSRDIEGENPLYLPQAKVYDQSCALGPCITLRDSMPGRDETGIHMAVVRREEIVFEGRTNAGQMARSFEHLIGYLGRDNTFRHGAILLTGTGIVPADDFTLRVDDTIHITIDGIGTLVNRVAQG